MQQLFSLFYRSSGIRRPQQLITPLTTPEVQFQLPRNSVLHYTETDARKTMLTEEMPIFGQYTKRIMVEHIVTLKGEQGRPVKSAVQPVNLYRELHQKNKMFKLTFDAVNTVSDPLTLIVQNYSFLDDLYRYTEIPMTSFYRWHNIQTTLWSNIADLCTKSDREHFVMVDVPLVLPSFMTLNMYMDTVNVTFIKLFETPEKLFLMELWKWLSGSAREKSVIGHVGKEHLSKVNLVFRYHGKTSVMNLGYMDAWLKGSETEIKDAGTLRLDSTQVQKLFLKFLIELKSIADVPVEEEVIEPEMQASPEPDTEDDENDNDDIMSGVKKSGVVTGKKTPDSGQAPVFDEGAETDVDPTFDLNSTLKEIEDDLKALDVIEKKSQIGDTVIVSAPDSVKDKVKVPKGMTVYDSPDELIYKDKTVEQSLTDQINQLADYGVMSASDYRTSLKQAQAYANLPDPYGKYDTIVEAATVQPEELTIAEEDKVLKVNETILDPSMGQSAVKSFDKKYVTTIMPKDIVACVKDIQKAGIVIQSHTVDIETSITGEYEIHTLKIKPIDGVSSTVRFKLPRVDDQGRLTVNATSYIMRKQRADLPIRKIKPTVVALSSYYGKTFVSRSTKKANDPIAYLSRNITLAGMSGSSEIITSVSPANVFDNKFKAPLIYSALAQNFKAFTANGIHFVFDHRERHLLYPDAAPNSRETTNKERMNAAEGGENRLGITVGKTATGNLVYVMVKDNMFYEATDSGLKLLGTIFDIVGLDEQNAPINYTELKVFSKSIPVGIALAYMIGFDNLLKFLKVEYRTVEPRKVKNLQKHEWVLQFKDIHYIFSRRDERSTMILAGFLPFEKSIKNYFQDAFNNKNVYLNVLDSQSISATYLRELELMDQLFVDPITLDILKQMKEPTTFKGLVIRSVEMMLDQTHRDPQDMTEMRIKGYERFAGAVYKEMVGAVRAYKAKNIRGKSQIDLNPYAVWRNVMDDPSLKIVEDINPIQNVKEKESVTYAGEGGRSKDSMNKASRAYHESDIGVISEATVDSSDVGINVFMSANPNLKSLRGLTDTFDPDKNNYASMLSTSALLAPGSTNDD